MPIDCPLPINYFMRFNHLVFYYLCLFGHLYHDQMDSNLFCSIRSNSDIICCLVLCYHDRLKLNRTDLINHFRNRMDPFSVRELANFKNSFKCTIMALLMFSFYLLILDLALRVYLKWNHNWIY